MLRAPISSSAWNEHLHKGWPIACSSASPAFRVAARHTHFGLLRLDPICETAFELDRRWRIAVSAPIRARTGALQRGGLAWRSNEHRHSRSGCAAQ